MATIKKISVVYNVIPFIVVEYEGTGGATTGKLYDDIELNELSVFVSLLEQQQTALGDYVRCSKSTYTQNGKSFPAIVFEATDQVQPVYNPVNCNITLDGIATGALNDVQGFLYSERVDNDTLRTDYEGALFTIKLPVIGINGRNDVLQDYNFNPSITGDVILLQLEIDAGYYRVIISFPEQRTTFAITTRPYLTIDNQSGQVVWIYATGAPLSSTIIPVGIGSATAKISKAAALYQFVRLGSMAGATNMRLRNGGADVAVGTAAAGSQTASALGTADCTNILFN